MNGPPVKSARPLNLLELLRAVGKKAGMYIGPPGHHRSIWHLKSFIVGFQSGSIGRGPYQEGTWSWTHSHFGFARVLALPMASGLVRTYLRHCDEDEETAFQMFFELLEEYVKDRERTGQEQIKNRFLKMLEKLRNDQNR